MQNEFVGTWKLISFQYRDQDGKINYPYGDKVIGLIMYDSGGRMAVQIVQPGRPIFESDDRLNGSPGEIKAALEGFLGYFGAYTINVGEGTVTHHVEGSLFPNWMGQALKRFYNISGNTLTLTTPPDPTDEGTLTGVLTWERLTPGG